jgi:hypothetical protein
MQLPYFISNASLLYVFLSYLCGSMKVALYILAVYTILLSCIPCQDKEVVSLGIPPVISMSATVNQPPHDLPDLCSPFCICTCCAGMDIPVLKTYLPEKPAADFARPSASPYTSAIPSGGASSVWQPPRA